MVRLRVFEYAKFRIFEFSDLKISDICRGRTTHSIWRGNKIYYKQRRGKQPIFDHGMTFRSAYSGLKFEIIGGNFEKFDLVGNFEFLAGKFCLVGNFECLAGKNFESSKIV